MIHLFKDFLTSNIAFLGLLNNSVRVKSDVVLFLSYSRELVFNLSSVTHCTKLRNTS